LNDTLQKATFLLVARLLYIAQNLLWCRQDLRPVLLQVLMMLYFFRRMQLGSLLNYLPGDLNLVLPHKVILYKCATQQKLNSYSAARLKKMYQSSNLPLVLGRFFKLLRSVCFNCVRNSSPMNLGRRKPIS